MDNGSSSRAPAATGGSGVFDDNANNNNGADPSGGNGNVANGRGGTRRLTNIEQQLLSEDNAAGANASAGFYRGNVNGLNPMGMYGAGGAPGDTRQQQLNSLYGAGLQAGIPGLNRGMLPGQFDDQGLAGLQQGMGNLSAMNMNVNQLRNPLQQQQASGGNLSGAPVGDFQGLMSSNFDGSGSDPSAALLGNPAAAMAGYPMFNASGLGVDGTAGGAGGILNPQLAAAQGAPGVGRNGGGPSLFDQGYNFARSEMALVRHQAAAFNNNLMAAGAGGQLGLAALDRQNAAAAAGLRGLGPYPGNYGATDPMMAAAAAGAGMHGMNNDPYGRSGMGANASDGANAQHLATIPAIRLAQHRSALQRRMMANSLPERKDGSFPVVLYQESDEHKLTAYQCLLRKQLELFEADEDDVRCSTRQGRTAPIKLGQVGLRCRHCAGVQLAARTKGAAYYSQTVEGIYQIAQNMSKVHLCERCYRIPRDVRRQLIVLRSDCRRAIGGKEYWSENIRALGVYVDEGILRVKKTAPKEEEKTDSKDDTTKEEDKEKGDKTTSSSTEENKSDAADTKMEDSKDTGDEGKEKSEDKKEDEDIKMDTKESEADKPSEGNDKPKKEDQMERPDNDNAEKKEEGAESEPEKEKVDEGSTPMEEEKSSETKDTTTPVEIKKEDIPADEKDKNEGNSGDTTLPDAGMPTKEDPDAEPEKEEDGSNSTQVEETKLEESTTTKDATDAMEVDEAEKVVPEVTENGKDGDEAKKEEKDTDEKTE